MTGSESDKLDDIYYSSGIPDRNAEQNALLGYDAAGNLKGYLVVPKRADVDHQAIYTVTYDKFDSYVQGSVTAIRGTDAVISNNDTSTTTNTYDQNGYLVKVQETGSPARTFINDANGVALRASWDGERVDSLVVNGELIGSSDSNHNATAADFATTYQSAVASGVATTPSVYIVQTAGETLQSVAQAVWGDSKQWYLIADANGIGSSGELAQGTQLKLPARVNTLHNDYQSYKPYSPTDLIGDTTPALPAPAGGQDGGCGGWGQLLLAAVAAAAFVVAAPLGAAVASTLGGGALVAGAVDGVVASVVSQGVGVATGIQDQFSWKSVGLAALASGISGELTGLPASGSTAAMPGVLTSTGGSFISGNTAAAAAARAVVTNVVTQGVEVATGLRDRFQWRNVVAAAGGAAIGQGIAENANEDLVNALGRTGVQTLSSFAGNIGGQALGYGRVNFEHAATDEFGNALGNSLAYQGSSAQEQKFAAMDARVDDVMADVLGDGERLVSNTAIDTRSLNLVDKLHAEEMARITSQAREEKLTWDSEVGGYRDTDGALHVDIAGVNPPVERQDDLVEAAGGIAIETPLAVLSGTVASVVAPLYGVYTDIASGKFGTPEGIRIGEEAASQLAQRMTFKPQTATAQYVLGKASDFVSYSGIQGLGFSELSALRSAASTAPFVADALQQVKFVGSGSGFRNPQRQLGAFGNIEALRQDKARAANLGNVGNAGATTAVAGGAAEPLLLGYTPTTNTLAQIRRMSQPQAWQAGEQYVQELAGSSGQAHFTVPAGPFGNSEILGSGGRFVDAPVTATGGSTIANEVKTYKHWTTVNGSPVQQTVPLSPQIQQQVLKDSWLQTNVQGYNPRWIFLDAPPSSELTDYLTRNSIDYVIHN